MTGRFDPAVADVRWQARWEEAQQLRRRHGERQAQDLRPGDVPLSVGAHPHGPRSQLHDGRRPRPLPPDAGARGAAPDGLGRVRHAGRECGDGAQASIPANGPGRTSPACGTSSNGWASRWTGAASSRPATPIITGTSRSCSSICTRPGSSTARRARSIGTRSTMTVLANEQVIDGKGWRSGAPGRAAAAVAMVPEDHRLRRGASRRARASSRIGPTRSS